MANKQRGEVVIKIGGKSYTAALTLGALAHLEDAFGIEKAGELDAIISFPTYNQLARLAVELINYRQDQPRITLEEILAADVSWQDVYQGIVAAVGAINPKKGEEGKGESKEGGT